MVAVWSGLNRTLNRLDAIAGDPELLDEQAAVEALRRLQNALHLANEQLYGLVPPAGTETAHAELADALVSARDATAEVADAAEEDGLDGIAPLLHAWRGALFRIRLARLRLVPPRPRAAAPAEAAPEGLLAPFVAFLLALVGAAGFVAGATLGIWPLWAAGLVAVCGSVLAYRP